MAKSNVSLGGRDILDLESLSVEEIELVLKTAEEMKKIMKRDIKKVPSLRGKSIINLFYVNIDYLFLRCFLLFQVFMFICDRLLDKFLCLIPLVTVVT